MPDTPKSRIVFTGGRQCGKTERARLGAGAPMKLTQHAVEVMRKIREEKSVSSWRLHSTNRSSLYDKGLIEFFKEGLFEKVRLTPLGRKTLEEIEARG